MLRTTEAVKHFGSVAALAEALNISMSAVCQWGKHVPRGSANELQVITGGKLVAGEYPKKKLAA